MFGKYRQSVLLCVRYFHNSFFPSLLLLTFFFHCVFYVIKRNVWMLLGTFRERKVRSHLNTDDLAINISALPQPYYNDKKKCFPLSTFLLFYSSSLIWFLSTSFALWNCCSVFICVSEVFNPLEFLSDCWFLRGVRNSTVLFLVERWI